MINSGNVKIGLGLIALLLQSCTTIYFANNGTDKNQRMVIIYKNGDQARDDRTGLYQKKGDIVNITKECDTSTCILKFDVVANKVLPLTSILYMTQLANEPKEERIVYLERMDKNVTGPGDTILYKKGRKVEINKFESRIKPFNFLGKKTFVYYFK